jgi:hypothetical protein
MLINHFGRFLQYRENKMRKNLRHDDRLVYCWFDFDCAIMFPPSSIPNERRLPASEACIHGCNIAYDTFQGELDYDPFAYDVGALGMLLCEQFQVRQISRKGIDGEEVYTTLFTTAPNVPGAPACTSF